MNRITAAVLTLALSVPVLAQSPEALRSATLGSSFQTALDNGVPVPAQAHASAPVYAAQTRSYDLGGFTWENDAKNALQSASASLHNAGLKVLRGEVTRQANGREFGFRIEYFEGNDPLVAPRAVVNTRGGEYVREEHAKTALANEENLLRARGNHIVLGETLRHSDWRGRYYWRISYTPNGQPHHANLHTSGVYGSHHEAQRGLNESAFEFRRKGFRVWDERIYRDPSTRWYFFQFRYAGRR